MQSLVDDYSKYLQTYEMLLAYSAEHQCMKDLIHTTLQDVLASIGKGEPILNMMGVGSGSGEIEMEILKVLHEKHPNAKVVNEVVEPSEDMLIKYKALLSKTQGLEHVTFHWNKVTATEFELDWMKRNSGQKMHFINMIQMLYYVENPLATVSFYRSLLHKDGKILVILVAGESAWARLVKGFQSQLCKEGMAQTVNTSVVKSFLESKNIPYRNYKLCSLLDVTECFTPGDKKGDRLLDLLTEVVDFRKTAPPELVDKVLEFLKRPDNSQTVKGRILFDCSTEALLIDA